MLVDMLIRIYAEQGGLSCDMQHFMQICYMSYAVYDTWTKYAMQLNFAA